MAYTIIISEEQRSALESLVRANPECFGPDKPLEYWPEMLAELPNEEAASPNLLHGFCL